MSPECPGLTFAALERAKGFEPSTPTLASEKLRRVGNVAQCARFRAIARLSTEEKAGRSCTQVNTFEWKRTPA